MVPVLIANVAREVVRALLIESGRELIEYIFEPQATSSADELVCRNLGGIVAGYRPDGGVICLPKPTPPPNTPLTKPIPSISKPPKNIYQDDVNIYQDDATEITINVNYPSLPERRLSNRKLPTGGGRSESILKKVITVNTAIKNAKYGHLLHEPISNSPVAFQVCKNGDHIVALKEKQNRAAEKFLNGLFAVQEITEASESNSQLLEPSYSISEMSLALVSTNNSSAGALFGIEGISDFIGSFLSRSVIDGIPITGTIPLNYEYIDCEHNETQINDFFKNLKTLNIQEYIESLGLNNVSNQLSSLSAKSHTLGNLELEYLYNQVISTSAKANTVVELPESLGQEYLHNQLISISAKTGTTGTTEITETQYLYNQLISSSVKNSLTDVVKLLEIVGIDDFPISVPESLIKAYSSDPSVTPPPVAQKNLTSLPQLLHWYIERFDEIMGQWGVAIEIKDTDATTVGDQSKVMNFPNIAELLAEMMMLMFQISINSELQTNLNTRILMEAGQDKQQNLITYKLLQSLTDYIGYNYKDKIIEMPLLFNPNATEFDQLLTEVQIKVPVPEFNEKLNLQADFMRFRKAASILDSVYFKKVDPNGDIKAQLMKRLFDMRDSLKDMNKNDDESLKEFFKQVEMGFTATPGVGDATKPYGNDYEDRPRFKDFTELQNPTNE